MGTLLATLRNGTTGAKVYKIHVSSVALGGFSFCKLPQRPTRTMAAPAPSLTVDEFVASSPEDIAKKMASPEGLSPTGAGAQAPSP